MDFLHPAAIATSAERVSQSVQKDGRLTMLEGTNLIVVEPSAVRAPSQVLLVWNDLNTNGIHADVVTFKDNYIGWRPKAGQFQTLALSFVQTDPFNGNTYISEANYVSWIRDPIAQKIETLQNAGTWVTDIIWVGPAPLIINERGSSMMAALRYAWCEWKYGLDPTTSDYTTWLPGDERVTVGGVTTNNRNSPYRYCDQSIIPRNPGVSGQVPASIHRLTPWMFTRSMHPYEVNVSLLCPGRTLADWNAWLGRIVNIAFGEMSLGHPAGDPPNDSLYLSPYLVQGLIAAGTSNRPLLPLLDSHQDGNAQYGGNMTRLKTDLLEAGWYDATLIYTEFANARQTDAGSLVPGAGASVIYTNGTHGGLPLVVDAATNYITNGTYNAGCPFYLFVNIESYGARYDNYQGQGSMVDAFAANANNAAQTNDYSGAAIAAYSQVVDPSANQEVLVNSWLSGFPLGDAANFGINLSGVFIGDPFIQLFPRPFFRITNTEH